MNKNVTSKEELISISKAIAYEEGLSQINIRKVASKCGVSIGAIYNYFPTKSDLVMAVVEDFWKNRFKEIHLSPEENENFIEYCEKLFKNMGESLSVFKKDFLQDMVLLSVSEKEKGKKLEESYLGKIKECMLIAIDNGSNISKSIWDDKFTKEDFVTFVFSNMIMLLRQGQTDCRILIEVIIRILNNN